MDNNPILWGAVILVLLILLFIFAIFFQFIGLFVRCRSFRVRVSMRELIGMRLRRVNPIVIVNSRIQATRAGLNISQAEMETHVLAGGNVQNVISAMIAANKANIELPWTIATAIDLAGRNIFEAVQTSVNPKVIDVPNQAMSQTTIDGQSQDGIELKVKARVTVRTNIQRLVGGATEETIVARVGEGIVNAIGSAEDYKHVLKNPDSISKTVLNKGLDANTAFEILSIDIAEIKVGENIGAKLAADRAESDKRRFQAEAGVLLPRKDGRRSRTGERRQAGGESRDGHSGRGRNTPSDGGCVPQRQPRRDGLLQAEKCASGYQHARSHC